MKLKRLFDGRQPTDWIALGLLLAYVVAFSWMAIRQHQGFRTNALDLGKFDQMIWNASQGRRPFSTITSQSAVQGHFSPGLALYAPLYWLWSDIRLLFVVQSICLGGAGFLIYWFIRGDAPWLGLAVYVAYLLHPSLHQVNLVEFRRVTAAVLAASFSIYHVLKRQYRWMVIGVLLALLCKENMAFLAIAVGLYVSLAHRSLKTGLPVIALGLLWLTLIPTLVVPAFGGTYRATKRYFSYLGRSLPEMLVGLLRNPLAPLQFALRPQRWTAVLRLCWPMGFLFLLAPEIAAFALPFLGYLLISTSKTMGRLGAWYPSAILPILFWAVVVGLKRLQGRWRTGAAVALLTAALAGYLSLSEIRPGLWAQLERFRVTEHHRQVEAALRAVPSKAVVAAQDPLVPHLSHRQYIYLFPWAPEGSHPDYVVLDREMKTYPVETPTYRTLFYELLSGVEHEIEQQIGDFYVFRYAGSVNPEEECEAHWEESMTLTGYTVAAAPAGATFGPVSGTLPAGSTLRLSLFWRVESPIEGNHTVFVHALSPDGQVLAQHDGWPADAHRPTSVLPVGTVFRDVHYLTLSETAPAGVGVDVGLYDGGGERLQTQKGQETVTLSICE